MDLEDFRVPEESGQNSPSVAHAYTMVNITQAKFEEFVGQDTRRISEAKERMIRKYSP